MASMVRTDGDDELAAAVRDFAASNTEASLREAAAEKARVHEGKVRYVESRISSLVDSKREMLLRRSAAMTDNLIASFDAIIKDMEEEIAWCHIKRRALKRAAVTDANKDATDSDSE